MAFKRNPQKVNGCTKTVVLGVGESAITLGGENVRPLYTFDAPIVNKPRVGIEITDAGVDKSLPGIAAAFEGAETFADMAKKAEALPGVDFICISLIGADPNGEDKGIDECAAICKEIGEATNLPIVVSGSKNAEKDAKLFEKCAEALQGKNALFMSATEDNYKAVAASAGMAYSQKIAAESAVDINLAKQLNVLVDKMGLAADNVVMNVGSAAAGYGYEYVASTMDRVKAAALEQNDGMLQNPIITPIAGDAWSVKEALASEADYPVWGPAEKRGIAMEITTAAACLASGSNAVILKHPQSVAAVSKFIAELM